MADKRRFDINKKDIVKLKNNISPTTLGSIGEIYIEGSLENNIIEIEKIEKTKRGRN